VLPIASSFVFYNTKKKILAVIDIKRRVVSHKTYHTRSTSWSVNRIDTIREICIEWITARAVVGTQTGITPVRAGHVDTSFSNNQQ